MQSINPYDQSLLQEHAILSPQALQDHLKEGHLAFQTWKKRSFQARANHFERLADLLEAGAKKYGQLITAEMGKPLAQAEAEVKKCAVVCRYYAAHAADFLADQVLNTSPHKSKVVYQPMGIILQIMPWNFPFWQVFRFAAPTLMAGNVTLLKHAPNVLGCAASIATLFEEAGFPKGVFQQIVVEVSAVEELLADTRVRGVALTGSVGAGQVVGALAGKYLKPCVLELGGSDPFIVLKDADLEAAATAAVQARMHNSGQTCIAAKRFIVERAIEAPFKALLKEKIQALKVGDPKEVDTDVSVLAREDLATQLQKQVDGSVAQGAVVEVAGGHQEGSNLFQPMLLSDLKKGMPAYEEELFGPVATYWVAEDMQAAIDIANNSKFGLGASVWTKDAAKAEEVSLGLDVGAVAINQIMRSDPRVPFGGTKLSGLGRELGREGILSFVNLKAITGI